MDSQQLQDNFILKKLLYKFDKKIQQLFQSFFVILQQNSTINGSKMIDQKQQNHQKDQIMKKLTKQQLLQKIQQLEFQNFKYRTALLSAKKDQTYNQEILQKSEQQINQTKKQVKQLSNELQLALKARKNKQDYNQLAESLKNYQAKSVQDAKLSQIEKQIQEMQSKYNKELSDYEKKQKCLKLALSALKGVIEWNEIQQTENQNGKLTNFNTQINSNENKQYEVEGGQVFY